jgi:hypothetical protein
MTFLGDWYRVRMGSDLGLGGIPPQRREAYRRLQQVIAARAPEKNSVEWSFGRLLAMFERFAFGLPSRNFIIDAASGAIERSALS